MIRRSRATVNLVEGCALGPSLTRLRIRPGQQSVSIPKGGFLPGSSFFAKLCSWPVLYEAKMMFKRHNPNLSLALECALLFLAISVFSWGLQAKISGYNGDSGASASTRSMAKLSTEEPSTRVAASLAHSDIPRFTCESLHLVAAALMQQGNHVPPAYLSQPRPGPRIPGQYNLHGPDLMRRPPPVAS